MHFNVEPAAFRQIDLQIELNDIPSYSGISSEHAQKLLCTIGDILRAPWRGSHTCDQPDMDEFVDCNYCQETAIFYEVYTIMVAYLSIDRSSEILQMLMELMERLCPKDDVIISMPKDDDNFDWGEELTETDDAGESSRGHMSSSVTSPQGMKSRDHTLIDMRGIYTKALMLKQAYFICRKHRPAASRAPSRRYSRRSSVSDSLCGRSVGRSGIREHVAKRRGRNKLTIVLLLTV